MEHGTHCHLSDCNRLDFLPVRCPLCSEEFCFQHHLPKAHNCQAPGASEPKEDTFVDPAARKAASTSARTPCPVPGCKRLTLQVEGRTPTPAGVAAQSRSSSAQATPTARQDEARTAFTHAAPRCYRCQGLFCPEHRVPATHGCTAAAPKTEGQIRAEVADERKRRAQELLSKHFPKAKKKS
ncbi:hypothetical protein V8E36_003993 [Tilletia maclaganii]